MAYIINGELIGDEVLEEEFDAIKDHYASLGEVVCCDRDEEFMGFARENIVNRTLLTQEADKRFGPPKDEDVDQMIAQLKEEHGGEKAFYDNTGFNPGDEPRIKEKVRATIGVDQLLETADRSAGVPVVTVKLPVANANFMRQLVDRVRQKSDDSVVVVGAVDGERCQLLVGVSKGLVSRVKAGDVVRQIAPVIGGGGGGRPDLAQAGGKDPSKLDEAIEAAKALVLKTLG